MVDSLWTKAGAVLLGLALGNGFTVVNDQINPRPIHLEVALVEYLERDGLGYFSQRIMSSDGFLVPADWRVQIVRRDDQGTSTELCKGKGSSNYHGEKNTWVLDEWAGDDCPDVLGHGDDVEVTWTYTNEFGVRVTIGVYGQIEKGQGDARLKITGGNEA